ncbi:MAG: hypothetical protein WBN61_11105 [Woeseiaceae bacterium]
MTDLKNMPWGRLAVEAAAIVGSILLAFAIDAWWHGRKDHLQDPGVAQSESGRY